MWRSMRRMVLWCGSIGILYGTLGQANIQAQTAAGKDAKKNYTNRPTFNLPVKVDDRYRETLRELCLFIKNGQGDWVKQETVLPSAREFPFTAPQDGEYWFAVAMIDRNGKMTPDFANLQPVVKVVIDTRPPLVEVKPSLASNGEMFMKCAVVDVNADLTGLRVTQKLENGSERTFESEPGQPGTYRILPEMWSQPLRITAVDYCGNVSGRDLSMAELFPGTPAPVLQNNHRPENNLPPSNPIVANKMSFNQPRELNNPPGESTFPQISEPVGVSSGPQGSHIPAPPILPHPVPSQPLSQGPLGSPSLHQLSPSPGLDARTAPGGNRQWVKTMQPALEYRIDQVGASGVGKVEVFITTDRGQTWQRHKEDLDKRSPVELDLPSDGEYGIRIVVTNGNGFGGTTPRPGDAPSFFLEVDTQAPQLKFQGAEQTSGGNIDLRWTAQDRNLGIDPIALYYRTQPTGPWQPIVRNLKNEGQFRWNFPRELGSQFFFKIEATDQAGNTSRVETTSPVVIDTTEPRAVVLGVSENPGQPSLSPGQ